VLLLHGHPHTLTWCRVAPLLARNLMTEHETNSNNFATKSVVSEDGTTIGYRQVGYGPGLIIIHGALESSSSYTDMATALANSFTVYIPDRRGRGLSGSHGDDYGLLAEVSDIRALIEETGSIYLYGVSSGAIIALESALAIDTVQKVVAYEPAFSIPGYDSSDFVQQYDDEIREGKTADAILTVLKGAELGPRWLRLLPRWGARRLIGMLIAEDEQKAARGEVTFTSLVPTLHYDFLISDEGSRDLSKYKKVTQEVLLLGGSKTPKYLKAALDTLEQTLPCVQRIEFPGFDHVSSGNGAKSGKPAVVAETVKRFLLD
jgi:pimeloyl-ACP methyl ester carboxylesterase